MGDGIDDGAGGFKNSHSGGGGWGPRRDRAAASWVPGMEGRRLARALKGEPSNLGDVVCSLAQKDAMRECPPGLAKLSA